MNPVINFDEIPLSFLNVFCVFDIIDILHYELHEYTVNYKKTEYWH